MKKNLGEELRENREAALFSLLDNITGLGHTETLSTQAIANALADRIEAEYLPRPRYEDGEVVNEGDANTLGTVDFYEVDQDGDFVLHYKDGETVEYSQSERVPKAIAALDADGVPCKVGDTVYFCGEGSPYYGEKFEVKAVDAYGGLTMCGSLLSFDPKGFTHRKPDTLEGLKAEAKQDYQYYWGCQSESCMECPAVMGGKLPRERYGVHSCRKAMTLDLVERAAKLKK